MGLLDSKRPVAGAVAEPEPAIVQADQSCRTAEQAVRKAVQALGEAYFQANKDRADAEFHDQIAAVKDCMEKARLWFLYRLSLEGKVQCDSCGAIITVDSTFCNKCGSSIPPRDYSVIGMAQPQVRDDDAPAPCPFCASPLVAGAVFCEQCGRRVSGGDRL